MKIKTWYVVICQNPSQKDVIGGNALQKPWLVAMQNVWLGYQQTMDFCIANKHKAMAMSQLILVLLNFFHK